MNAYHSFYSSVGCLLTQNEMKYGRNASGKKKTVVEYVVLARKAYMINDKEYRETELF